jgi:hypothetical protein
MTPEKGEPMRKFRVWIAAGAIFLVGSVAAPADGFFLYGQQFLTACENSDALQLGVCLGFIQGVADALQDQHAICLPRVGARELRLLVIKFLRERPDSLGQPAMSLVSRALGGAYPCAKA